MDLVTLEKLAVTLGLGLLIGLQRERVHSPLAGIRTFALIALLGFLCGLSSSALGPWPVAVGGLGMIAYMFVGYIVRAEMEGEEADPGLTTEVAALVIFILGAYIVQGETNLAIVIGGAVVLLLHLKRPMHAFVERIGEHEVRAIMQFVLVALVILPLLPNQNYGPWNAFNPFVTWLMVVLIVGINLAAYVLYKFLGGQEGTLLAGFLGGLISSTATTLSFARRASAGAVPYPMAALVIMVATATAQIRIMAELAVVATPVWIALAGPLAALLFGMLVVCGLLWWGARQGKAELMEPANPAELKAAISFGLIYAVVTFAIAAAREYFGASGLYTVAFFSGLHDLDAITLSTGQSVQQGDMESSLGWRLILTACLANLIFKTGLVLTLGPRALGKTVALMCGGLVGLGILVICFWP